MQVQGNRHRRNEHPCYEMVGTWLNCIRVFSVQECSVQECSAGQECSMQGFSAGQDLLKCLVKDASKKGSIPADVRFPLTAL